MFGTQPFSITGSLESFTSANVHEIVFLMFRFEPVLVQLAQYSIILAVTWTSTGADSDNLPPIFLSFFGLEAIL